MITIEKFLHDLGFTQHAGKENVSFIKHYEDLRREHKGHMIWHDYRTGVTRIQRWGSIGWSHVENKVKKV